MPNISTLIADIYKRVSDGKPFSDENIDSFAKAIAAKLKAKFQDEKPRHLSLSSVGKPCLRQLWYQNNTPELAEPLPAAAKIKFFFGDVLEELVLLFAREAGHKVDHEQKEVHLEGIAGHTDGVVDGRVCDIKSASTRSFEKFQQGTLHEQDDFGYLAQLDGYSNSDLVDLPEVTDKKNKSFIAIDKQLGHMCLATYPIAPKEEIVEKIRKAKAAVSQSTPPERAFKDKKQTDTSPNMVLDVACSYCPYKWVCWPNLRCFIYSKGPTYFTRIVKHPQPHINEVDRDGNILKRTTEF